MSEASRSRPNCDITRYSVLSLHAAKRDAITGTCLDVRPDIRVVDGKPEYRALLECRREVGAFSFSCAIEGDFIFHEPISQKNVLIAWVNGCTILYGIARNLYSSSAMQCVHEDLMLPTVMMIDVVKRVLEDLKQKHSGHVK